MNPALFTHVLGALLLIGGLLSAVLVLYAGWGAKVAADSSAYGRLAFRTLLFVAFPAWIIMRVGAEWIYSEEKIPDDFSASWLDVGSIVADAGGLLLLITIVLAGIGARRLRTGGGTMGTLGKVTTVLATVLLVAYFVAVWAMGAKPS